MPIGRPDSTSGPCLMAADPDAIARLRAFDLLAELHLHNTAWCIARRSRCRSSTTSGASPGSSRPSSIRPVARAAAAQRPRRRPLWIDRRRSWRPERQRPSRSSLATSPAIRRKFSIGASPSASSCVPPRRRYRRAAPAVDQPFSPEQQGERGGQEHAREGIHASPSDRRRKNVMRNSSRERGRTPRRTFSPGAGRAGRAAHRRADSRRARRARS